MSMTPVPLHRSHQSCGGRSRTCGPVVQSHVFLPTETTPQSNVQSALRESNPPVQLGRLVPKPIGQGHVLCRRKERESNPQSSCARPASNGVPSPIGLPFRFCPSSGGRNRTSNHRLNKPTPYRLATPDHVSQDDWIRTSDLLRPKQAESQTFPRPESSERSAGIEPAPPAWQASALPLRHERLVGSRIVKDHQSTGRDSNPRRRITGAVSLPLDDQCVCSVGLVGIEPTSSGLRDRCITLSATIPFQSARWELNPRPASYKDAALTAELRASVSRAGGIRTHAMRIKSPPCCLLHHDPMKRSGVCVSSGVAVTSSVLLSGLVVSGSDQSGIHADRCPNRTRPGAVISRVWTTSPRLPCSSRARAESNRPRRRPQTANTAPAPEAGVLPSAPLPVCCQSERPRPIWHPCQSVPEPAISWPPTRRDTRLRHVLS